MFGTTLSAPMRPISCPPRSVPHLIEAMIDTAELAWPDTSRHLVDAVTHGRLDVARTHALAYGAPPLPGPVGLPSLPPWTRLDAARYQMYLEAASSRHPPPLLGRGPASASAADTLYKAHAHSHLLEVAYLLSGAQWTAGWGAR